jgi:uncharacterized protein (TIGR03066 family)
MAVLRKGLPGVLLLVVATAALAADKEIDKAKLVGTWTFVKTSARDKAPPPGAVVKVTFTTDGKITMSRTVKDRTLTMSGTYPIKGDQLSWVMTGPDRKESKDTATIAELTARKLVTRRKEGDNTVTTEFKK